MSYIPTSAPRGELRKFVDVGYQSFTRYCVASAGLIFGLTLPLAHAPQRVRGSPSPQSWPCWGWAAVVALEQQRQVALLEKIPSCVCLYVFEAMLLSFRLQHQCGVIVSRLVSLPVAALSAR